jgi:aspartyl-tRNA(Asn)/glutamyl-tRNA(Gln) amidotransferase subunit A
MLHRLSLTELSGRLARREVSAREALESCFAQIDRVDPQVKAFLSIDRTDALAQAEAADRGLASGEAATRPLLGVPIALKDVLCHRGQPVGCASKILEGFISPYDGTVVEKLKAAGAVLFGRLNMDEFAMGSSTENSAYGTSLNPWDTTRIPGGSSGGCAVAVAANEAFATIGSDTGGSIRQPAALCGCVGVKPTYGRVSRYGLVAFASSLDQIGPFTKTVADAALLLETISGHDRRDSTSLTAPVPRYRDALGSKSLKGLKLGVVKEFQVGGLDTEVESSVAAAVKHLESLGAEIREVSLPHSDYAAATYYILAPAEASANLARFDGVRYGRRVEGPDPFELNSRTRGAGFGPEVKRRIILGTYVLSSGYYDAYYLRAQKVRTLISNDFNKAFGEVDAILSPTAPTPAFRVGEKASDPLQMYLSDIFTISCNLAGICGLSVPCGFTSSPKLPIGLQLLGRPLGEETLLRIADAYEQTTPWHREVAPLG